MHAEFMFALKNHCRRIAKDLLSRSLYLCTVHSNPRLLKVRQVHIGGSHEIVQKGEGHRSAMMISSNVAWAHVNRENLGTGNSAHGQASQPTETKKGLSHVA